MKFYIKTHKKNAATLTLIRLDNLKTVLFGCFIALFLTPSVLEAQTCSGTVFRDFNGNGTKDTNEPGVLGINVKAYNAAGTQVGSTATSVVTTGTWSITTGTTATVRVEFSIPTNANAQDYTGEGGATYGSSVQFVAGNATNINFSINYPDDYWSNTTQPIPQLMLPCYVNGAITSATKDEPAIVQFGNDQNGLSITKNVVAKWSETGTVWGNAYERTKDRFFYSAFLKRHSGFGPLGAGGVYMVEKVSGVYKVNGSFNLQGVVPSNTATPIDLGAVTRTTTLSGTASNTANNNYIANDATNKSAPSRDMDAFAKVGKMSFGGIDLDEATKQLYMVNLFQRTLIQVDVSGTTSSLNGVSAATLGTLTKTYSIMALPGIPSCTAGTLRPWALKIYKGKGYLGLVCDGNVSGTLTSDVANLTGYVLSFDPNNIAAGFTTVLTLALKYPSTVAYRWNQWADTWAQTGIPTTTAVPGIHDLYFQAIFSDIDFDEKGGMTLAFIDRLGHQTGFVNYVAVSGSTSTRSSAALGELLYACYNATTGTWTMEGGAGCTAPNATTTHSGTNFKEGYSGTGANEYYLDTSGDDNSENGNGAVAQIKGTGKLIAVVNDPHPAGTIGATYYDTGGVQWFSTTAGTHSQYAQVFNNSTFNYGKATGLGDLEAALSPAPIEIGNRVWTDTDKDGIQDADETGIDGVTVKLFEGTTEVASTTTANGGQYYFTNANVTGGVKTNTAYEIRIATAQTPLSTLSLTTTDVGTNGSDLIDNDGTTSGANAIKAFTTGNAGENNHSYDFGFAPTCDTTLMVTNTTICNGATVNLFAQTSGVKGTLTYSTNGTTWTALTNPTNITPSVTTTYYIKDTLVSGCFDIDTLVITVNSAPTTPSVSSPIMNVCPLTTVDLTTISSALTPSVSGGVFEWHVSNSSSSAFVNNPTDVVAGDYYLFERSPAGCYSTGLKVTVTIQVCCPTKLCLPVIVTRN